MGRRRQNGIEFGGDISDIDPCTRVGAMALAFQLMDGTIDPDDASQVDELARRIQQEVQFPLAETRSIVRSTAASLLEAPIEP